MKTLHVYAFFLVVVLHSSCKQHPPSPSKEEAARPKLIKTIGSPRYGNVQTSLQDKAGNLWFGTTENGLYKYDGKSFTQFFLAKNPNSNNIFSLLEDNTGKIWIGTLEGLFIYDGKTFDKIQIPLPKNLPPNKNGIYRNTQWIFRILQARNGKLWLATIDGVYVYDGKSFTPFTIGNGAGGYASSNPNVEYILEDQAGNIWMGGRGNEGAFRYDGKSVTNIQLKELYQNGPKPKAHRWAWPQLQDKNGNIWFSNWGGVYRYDGKSFTSFTSKEGLAGDMVTRIIQDKKGNLWFGGAGLSRYDGSSFTRFSTKDGLPNLGVWSIMEDTNGNIWVGTRETGLYLYDGNKFITYSEYKQPPLSNK